MTGQSVSAQIIKWGYIDHTGKFVIQPRFSSARDFSDGLAWTNTNYANNIFDAINPQGNVEWSIKALHVWEFSDGLALVNQQINHELRYGYINKHGDFVIPPIYSQAQPFKDGRAKVSVEISNENGGYHFKETTIDTKGNTISDQDSLPYISSSIAHQLKPSIVGGRLPAEFQRRPEYVYVGEFHDGRAAVIVRKEGRDKLDRPVPVYLGFVDPRGDLVIPAEYEAPTVEIESDTWVDPLRGVHFSEGLAHVRSDGIEYLIDKSGKQLAKFFRYGCRDFSGGLAVAGVQVDTKGHEIALVEESTKIKQQEERKTAFCKLLASRLADIKVQNPVEIIILPSRLFESGRASTVEPHNTVRLTADKPVPEDVLLQIQRIVESIPVPSDTFRFPPGGPPWLSFFLKNGIVSDKNLR